MILIVDDNSENIFSLRKILEINGFEVDTALSGDEALKKVLRINYHLIILDVQMPGMDGFEVADAITGINKTKDIPILFLSAVNTHKKFVARGYQSGAIDYLTKPFDADILILKVKTFYRLYQQTLDLKGAQQLLEAEIEIRKKTERFLKETVEELHSTLESLPQIAFSADPEGKIEFVNQKWFEYSDDPTQFPKDISGTLDIEGLWKQTLSNGRQLIAEIFIQSLSKSYPEYFVLNVIPVSVKGVIRKWVGTFTNIHEQKMLNDVLENKVSERTLELETMNDKLELSNNDLQQFASVASHDLKEPLRKIQFFSSSIMDKFDVDPKMKFYLDKINVSSTRMSGLIDDLLNFSKLSEIFLFEKVDLNAILHDVLSDLELLITELDANIQVVQLPVIDSIPGLMRQLFQNILSNSLKFSVKGVKPVIVLNTEYSEKDNICFISITDNGIGFEQHFEDRIFNLFQRLHPKELYEGTGIGLTIVKKIVEKHHGNIQVLSSPGAGTKFNVQLPILQSNQTI